MQWIQRGLFLRLDSHIKIIFRISRLLADVETECGLNNKWAMSVLNEGKTTHVDEHLCKHSVVPELSYAEVSACNIVKFESKYVGSRKQPWSFGLNLISNCNLLTKLTPNSNKFLSISQNWVDFSGLIWKQVESKFESSVETRWSDNDWRFSRWDQNQLQSRWWFEVRWSERGASDK